MALEGTFETFSIIDVVAWLQLLNRTGQLDSQGANGDVHLWISDGGIVGAAASGNGNEITPALALFDVLRVGPAEWRFVGGEQVPDDNELVPVDVMELVSDLEAMVTEWAEILDVVPSGEAMVQLSTDVEGSITVNDDRWALVLLLAEGPMPAGELIDSIGLHDLAGRRRVADLVQAGVATVEGGAPLRVIDLTDDGRDDSGYEAVDGETVDQASA